MCKLIAMTNIPKGISHNRMNALLVKAAKLLGESQKDGLGIGVVCNDNKVYRERHVDPNTFNGLGSAAYTASALPKGVMTRVKRNVDFDTLGKLPDMTTARSIVMHGRTATSAEGIGNTHPFVKYDSRLDGDWLLAHNGVVEWEGKTKLPLDTTCDSEHILNCYAFLDGEKSFADNISGYAAVVGFNPLGELFVFRDNVAPLYISYNVKNHFTVICTDATHADELMEQMCKWTKTKLSNTTEPTKLDDWSAHLWPVDGSDIRSSVVKPFDRGYGRINSSYVSKSLGSAGVSGYNYGSSYGSYSSSSTSTTNPHTTYYPSSSYGTTSKPASVKADQVEIIRLADIDTAIANIEAAKENYDDETLQYIAGVKRRRELLAAHLAKEGRHVTSFLTERDQRFLFGKASTGINLMTRPNSMSDIIADAINLGDADIPTDDLDFLSDEDWQKRVDNTDSSNPSA